eukprot:4315392-Pleurochrysis_carterae.AAC.1
MHTRERTYKSTLKHMHADARMQTHAQAFMQKPRAPFAHSYAHSLAHEHAATRASAHPHPRPHPSATATGSQRLTLPLGSTKHEGRLS